MTTSTPTTPIMNSSHIDNRVDVLFESALERTPTAISYSVSKELACRFSGSYVLEAEAGYFDLEAFAGAGLCTITFKPHVHHQIMTLFHTIDYPLNYDARQAWRMVSWEGHALEVVQITWTSGHCETTQYWIIAKSREIAEAFYFAVCGHGTDLRGAVLVFEHGYWDKSYALYESIQRASFENIILAGDLKHRLSEDFSRFFASRSTYDRYGVPWKRGALLIGPPGNGKTQTVKALIKEMNVPGLYVKSISGDRADGHVNMRSVFQRARIAAPCILVLEDLDALVNPHNRSFFLNEMDGLAANTGVLVLATTNHPEKLDPAILDRPSRFDRKYHFNLPELQERKSYLEMWNSGLESDLRMTDAGIEAAAASTGDFSFAYMKELMLSAIMAWIDRETRPSMDVVMLEQADLLRSQMAYMSAETSVDTELYEEE